MIRDSFVSCAVTCATDGSQDDGITCFKVGKPFHEGRKMLKEQFKHINTEEANPFEANEDDIADASPGMLLVDEDEEGDEDVEIDI